MRKSDQSIAPLNFKGELFLYKSEDGEIRLNVRLEGETIWLTVDEMAYLFQVDKSGVSRHLKNIFGSGELEQSSVVAIFATTAADGKTYRVKYYNLDAIISVGYRVNSFRGTQFRIWAAKLIREYIVKGFAMDDARLKERDNSRYFEELLARIRDIRSSEKVFWRKVLDIYATSVDYDPHAGLSQKFFSQVQNKMHWAAHGHTAAELIYQRVDSSKPNMGITNYPGDIVLRRDTEIAKNYLLKEELETLNRMVTAYLEVAEIQALNRKPMTMKDWVSRLDDFLKMTGRDLLTHAGAISHESALQKAHEEYEKYNQKRLEGPSPVEEHFVEAEEAAKKFASPRKNLKGTSGNRGMAATKDF
ncbi:MAG: virulence RhuM family protein [Chthoniobacteraceae bacterium]